ncbi:hypothetical protein MPHL43072_02270 [Mycolicibacterium phlei DSM 43072]|uniref:SnoaL-like domain-containing protein n=1 Tax=Mycolicibacterium phlei DSM 43239 = CCUG 21000 TaxID=1226750 RepID=A0A5N5UYV7_MYCPH|nr:hypothetical protein MPHL21000_16610 [Mycolicibacterium phlei DSM 43239 = CCUG 21000]KXW65489.1 hypothetical protein MPHL43239_12435 [Mycolicibacterium phlei DSM 43239 = CCUG 21000]KXW69479.1 hypothetical protein MPHL43070_18650 [Mycolicibacterium phlei DSM 43070]KXW72629.1 hypothetical protein MPHL43072_02270 [Mycolicibacterium phlei DSM 43072]
MVSRFLEAATTGDVRTFRSLLSPEIDWWIPRAFRADLEKVTGIPTPEGESFRGLDSVMGDFLIPVMRRFVPGTARLTIDDLIGAGEKVAVVAHMEARLDDGGEYLNNYAFVMTVRDGRIISVREYLDTLYAVRALCG